eukprot:1840802-Amphidinium_carterae.1
MILDEYPLSMIVGPVNAHALSSTPHIMLPYVSTSFASRSQHSPLDLPFDSRPPQIKPFFAAYLAYNCASHRESFFALLWEASQQYGLGGVHALSRCGHNITGQSASFNSSNDTLKEQRYARSYFDDAVS